VACSTYEKFRVLGDVGKFMRGERLVASQDELCLLESVGYFISLTNLFVPVRH
jgi:hypothetical protein